jgi:MFS family permease
MNGFDGSIMGGINAMPPYLRHFNLSNTSPATGLVFAMYSAGGLVAVPFAGPISDGLGRRYGMLIGSLFIVLGTIVAITAPRSMLRLYISDPNPDTY